MGKNGENIIIHVVFLFPKAMRCRIGVKRKGKGRGNFLGGPMRAFECWEQAREPTTMQTVIDVLSTTAEMFYKWEEGVFELQFLILFICLLLLLGSR